MAASPLSLALDFSRLLGFHDLLNNIVSNDRVTLCSALLLTLLPTKFAGLWGSPAKLPLPRALELTRNAPNSIAMSPLVRLELLHVELDLILMASRNFKCATLFANQAKIINPVNRVISDKSVKVLPALFLDRVPGWPIGDTRRAFRKRRADFPARLQGLAAVCRVRFVRQLEKIPDAVFSGGIAALGRGFCAEVSHSPSAVIAALGG